MSNEKKMIEIIKKNPNKIKTCKQTKELVELAVSLKPQLIKEVKEEFITEDLLKKVIESKANLIKDFPKGSITRELALLALKKDRKVFNLLSKRDDVEFLLDIDFLEEAVKINGNWIKKINLSKQTREMAYNAVVYGGFDLGYINARLHDDELIDRALEVNGKNLRSVFEDKKDAKRCLIAVSQDGLALKYVPDKYKTKELCLTAIKNNGLALEFAPYSKEFRNHEVFLEAVKSNGEAIKLVPTLSRTKELCEEAYKNTKKIVYCIPEEFLTEDMYYNALKEHPSIFNSICDRITSERISRLAIELSPFNILYIKNQTQEIALKAVEEFGRLLEYVQDEFKTKEVCFKALEASPQAITYFPKDLITNELCINLIKEDAKNIAYIPKEFHTAELYMMAYEQNPEMIKHFDI